MGFLDSIKRIFGEKEGWPSVQEEIPAVTSSIMQVRLGALNELRDKGVISTQEYERQRANVLKRR